MKVVLFELVRQARWRVHEGYRLKLTSVSVVVVPDGGARVNALLLIRLMRCVFFQGGILAPLGCKIVFDRIEHRSNGP